MARWLGLMAAAVLYCGAGRASAAELDAAFVGMDVPDKLMAHEVFAARITMRNTGTTAWEGWPIRLRAVNPQGNEDWGTSYILIAQGKRVEPGAEYTFSSNLRARGEPGAVGFQWQVCKDGTHWFGATTPARTIEVTARPPAPEPKPPGKAPDGARVLRWDDIEYIGSFKAPQTVGSARGAFSESGLALRPMPDGRDRLLMNYTHPTQVLFEVEIPELAKVEGGNHAGLRTAEVKKVWGQVKVGKPGGQPIHPNGGVAWVGEKQTLFWTCYHGYKTGAAPPVLGATRLGEDGEMTHWGPWELSAPSGLYKAYWGGVMPLPAAFAERYTGGRRLALGFGGYYSICAPASRGPALGAIGEPDPAAAAVPVLEMLCHRHDAPAPRDGDYLNANCGFWGEQPESSEKGTWTYDDWCRAGAFVDAPAGQAYVAFVRLATGRLGYDYGTITSAGAAQYWYFYDANELGEAAQGKRKPWQVAPSSMAKVTYPLGRTVTGACYDARSRRLYLCVSWAYPNGRESYPAVHAYRVR